MTPELSPTQARRIALAAQGFGHGRPAVPSLTRLMGTVDRLNLLQIDSVNVLARAHYLPAFSRLGPYDQGLLERAAWGPRRGRRLFEYWAHEASLLPLDLHPLLRWRMARAERGEAGWAGIRRFSTERRPEANAILARIAADGPMSAADFENGSSASGWWQWSDAKVALEWLFWSGLVTTATRRGSFARVYDLPERVLPRAVLDLPTPDPADARRALVKRSARALGVATAGDLRDYFRLAPDDATVAIRDLADEGVLEPVAVGGGASRPGRTETRGRQGPSGARRCSRRPTRSSGNGPAPSGCSISGTGSKSTCPRHGACTATTCCPSSWTSRLSRGWT